jgi:hypothetical protein
LYFDRGPGIVRGADAELDIKQLLDSALGLPANFTFSLGGSAVSRYLRDDDADLQLPENTAALAGRLNLGYGGFNLFAEYAWKSQDPANYNQLFDQFTVYNRGSGLLLSASYSQKGFGATLSAKRLEMMDFRSARQADFSFNEVPINFLPPLARQHTYRLQTLYLYATAPNGEIGLQGDVVYTVPKGSALGGKYGMDIAVNVSEIHDLRRDTTGLVQNLEYASSDFLAFGDKLLYRDINIDITKKFSPKIKAIFSYVYATVDLELIRIGSGTPTVHNAIVDFTYKLRPRQALHLQAQHLFADSDAGPDGNQGSWAFLLAEYSIAPRWFFSVWDEWNYGNFNPDRRLHYLGTQVGYNLGGTRITAGYARQREGVVCIGGVCRVVPAANGFTFSLSSTF